MATKADLDKVQKRLDELLARNRGAVDAALYEEGFAVDALAAKKVPVDTGRLRATHYVTPPERMASGGSVVEIGFGTDYAVFVHEDTGARHTTGEAKFLEKAFAERAAGFAERLAKRATRNDRTGVGVRALAPRAPTSPQDPGPLASAQNIATERKQRRLQLKAKRGR